MITYNKKDIPNHLHKYFELVEIGLEKTPELYVENMVKVFQEVKRVLKKDGTLWLNLGDSYSGSGKGPDLEHNERHLENQIGRIVPKGLKPKDLIGIPWRVAFALQADGWYLRSDIIWHKPNTMPESVKDRPTKSHEYIFLLSKNKNYYYDYEIIKEDYSEENVKDFLNRKTLNNKGNYGNTRPDLGRPRSDYMPQDFKRNKRDVWTIAPIPFSGAHFAIFPPELILPCVLAGCPEGGTVLDPFVGSGTTGIVSVINKRNFVGIELNPDYFKMAEKRINTARACPDIEMARRADKAKSEGIEFQF